MKSSRLLAPFLCVGFAFAQQPDMDWNRTVNAVTGYAGRLQPILEQIKPQEWIAKGAPDAYLAQWQSATGQAKVLAAETRSAHADRLPEVLQLLFRIQSLEITTFSLEEGLRKYQNPALAELMNATRAESTPYREKLQAYALELANEKDQQYQLVDREAQRCRGNLSVAPRPGAPK